jgi:hypothetical protein
MISVSGLFIVCMSNKLLEQGTYTKLLEQRIFSARLWEEPDFLVKKSDW